MRNQGYFWGLFLVLLGGLLLLDNLGLLPGQVNVWSIFWPLVLIALGLRGVLGALNRRSAEAESLSIPLESVERARVRFRHGAGELRIGDGALAGDLLSGSFGGGVIHDVRHGGDGANVDLRMPDVNFPWFGVSEGMNWTVNLTPEVPLTLDLEVGASRNMLDLRNLQIKELHLSTGASATDIDLPANAGETRVWVKSGAASVNVRVPQGVAARIRTQSGLAGIDIDTRRFPHSGSVYQSPDYATAENRVDVDIETGVGSVSVR